MLAREKGGGEENILLNGAIQGLLTHDTNTLRIVKKVDTISFELNDVVKFSRTLVKYESDWSCISIFALTPSASIWIRDFKVEYKGGQMEI